MECESGVLVLDFILGFKWKVVCNKCNVVVYCFENVYRVRVFVDICSVCEVVLFDVDFNKVKFLFLGDET